MNSSYTLSEAFDYFEAQSNLSPKTLAMYRRAARLFCEFLENSEAARPLSLAGPETADRPLSDLGGTRQDLNILAWFINYLGREAESLKPRRSHPAGGTGLAPASVRLYGQALITWFEYLADELLLSESFPAPAAISQARRRLRTYVPATEARDSAPEPPEGIERLISAFDSPEIPNSLPFKEVQRRKLEALRNKALLYTLADSGARISEILRISAQDVRGARTNASRIWQVQVRGKGRGPAGRLVTLRFTEPTLNVMQEYLAARRDPGATALFVSHAKTRPEYHGTPLSANAAWQMIRRTARALGLPHIHPHDFRHWRATQMLKEDVPLDQVQRFLNHRSIRTTQLYAKTEERLVDAAGARTSPLTRKQE